MGAKDPWIWLENLQEVKKKSMLIIIDLKFTTQTNDICINKNVKKMIPRNSPGFGDINGQPNPWQKAKQSLDKRTKRTCNLLDFAFPKEIT